MKRVACLLMALVMMLSMIACNSALPQESKSESISETETAKESQPTTSTETEEVNPAGRIMGNTFESDFFGFGVNVPDSWVVQNSGEMQESTENAKDITKDTAASEFIENSDTALTFFAESATGSNININLQEATKEEEMLFKAYEETYLENIWELIRPAYEELGMQMVDFAIEKVPFCGKEKPAMVYSMDYMDARLYFVQLFFVNQRYASVATICSLDEVECRNILNYFYAL